MKPYWHKYLNDPDYDVRVSADGSHVSVAFLRTVPLAALKMAIVSTETVGKNTMPKVVMARELPQFKSHKIVRAAKIERMDLVNYKLFLEPDLVIYLDKPYFERHKPQAGGYFVTYDDGYESYSPAKAFEEGYTAIQAE